MELSIDTLEELTPAVADLLKEIGEATVVAFYGEMGAGKTTIINEMCRQLGVIGEGSSPTYSLVNQYLTADGETIYHFDCYRLKDEFEALDIGIEEYLDSGDRCFIEWPEKIVNLLPESCVRVEVKVSQETRLVKARK